MPVLPALRDSRTSLYTTSTPPHGQMRWQVCCSFIASDLNFMQCPWRAFDAQANVQAQMKILIDRIIWADMTVIVD